MPNYKRTRIKGGVYFFTIITHQRLAIFNDKSCIRAFRRINNDVCITYPFKEIASVILHDHIHSIWELPDDDCDFSKRWGIIKSRFTKYLRSTNDNACIKVWQNRFWEHLIRDSDDMINHIDYIHYNPVKHGYVNSVADWPYSSFHRFVDRGYYDLNWGSDVCFKEGIRFGE